MHPYHNVNKPNICSFFRNIKSIKNIWIFNEWRNVCNQNYPLLLHTMEAWRVQHNLGHFFATPYTRFIFCLVSWHFLLFSLTAWCWCWWWCRGAALYSLHVHNPHFRPERPGQELRLGEQTRRLRFKIDRDQNIFHNAEINYMLDTKCSNWVGM